jgi:hypothetical protein
MTEIRHDRADGFNHSTTQPMIDKIKETWAEVIGDADKSKYPRYHNERRSIDLAFEGLIKFVDPFYVRELELHCGLCCRVPATIPGIPDYAANEGLTPDEYVWQEEGTLNRDTGQFACDGCYIKLGMPSGPNGWRWGDSLN